MNVKVAPTELSGRASPPSSKSDIHRRLIAAALLSGGTVKFSGTPSDDIIATADCLRAMGADVTLAASEISVSPIDRSRPHMPLCCRESGSTLRFLLPVCAALGGEFEMHLAGRLPERPLAPLDDELRRHGANITLDRNILRVSGPLSGGSFTIDGGVSSQFVSGLLFSSLITDSDVRVTGRIESAPYIAMTTDAIRSAGVSIAEDGGLYHITDRSPHKINCAAEGDWSGAAFLVAAGALSHAGVTVGKVSTDSRQGDRWILDIVREMGASVTENSDGITVRRGAVRAIKLNAADVPDLVPAVAALAALADGVSEITGAARLRLKESDRIASVAAMVNSLGGDAAERPDGLVIRGRPDLPGGTVDSFGDHRIAMAAAILGSRTAGGAIIRGAECVSKSFPDFFECFAALGGDVRTAETEEEFS